MNISEQDYELLSAYLDGIMEDGERVELEARLEADSELRSEFNALYQTVQLVKSLPELGAPRSYTLTPEQALRIRNERVSSPAARDNKILRFVLPVLSAAASMALVLFGVALLLTSPNASPTSENIAEVPTQSAAAAAETGRGRIGVTPTVLIPFNATVPELAEVTIATDELTIEPFASEVMEESPGSPEIEQTTLDQAAESEEADGAAANDAADQAAPLAAMTVMPFATSMGFTEETEAPDGIFQDLFGTSDDNEETTGGAGAEPDEADAASAGAAAPGDTAASVLPAPSATLDATNAEAPLAAAPTTIEAPGAELQTLQESTLTETPLPTATITATASATESPTATASPTATPSVTPTATAPTVTRDVSAASPPSQLIGLVLVGLGLSLGVITLVIARRVASL